MEKLTKEETFEAVKEGVKEAFLTMMEAGDGFYAPIRTEEVMNAIHKGVNEAFYTCMPFDNDIIKAIENGTQKAMQK